MGRFCVEYAKSGRSRCQSTHCQEQIDKDRLRFGINVYDPRGYFRTLWHHLECEPPPKGLRSLAELDGFEKVSASDRVELIRWFGHQPCSTKRSREDTVSSNLSISSNLSRSLSSIDTKRMKVTELKAALKSYGLTQQGTRVALEQRLREFITHAREQSEKVPSSPQSSHEYSSSTQYSSREYKTRTPSTEVKRKDVSERTETVDLTMDDMTMTGKLKSLLHRFQGSRGENVNQYTAENREWRQVNHEHSAPTFPEPGDFLIVD